MRKSTLDYIDEKIKELSAEDRTKLDDRLIGLMVEDSAHKKLKYELDFGPDYIDEAMEMYNNFGKFQGMSTGYKSLDTFTKGLVGGELVIIGGATSGGKSSLALNIAGNVMKSGKSVLVVTLEMTKPQVISRMMIADKNFLDYSANLVFQKHDEFSWEDIDGIIENAKVNMNIDLVVVDHLHHFTRELRNTSEDIGRITKEFQKNAKRHKVPIILISHTRKGEGKGIDELRSSSYIAQDADIVLMVYRDRDYPGKIGVAIEKNRNRGYDFDNNSVLLNFDRTRIYEDYEQY